MNLANWLTFARIASTPVLFVLFVCGEVYSAGEVIYWIIFVVFVAAGLTDYFDGVVARNYRQGSLLGRLLDPIADKMLVISMMFLLAGYDYLTTVGLAAALTIILREILVSGIRQFVAQGGGGEIAVSRLAKWKTTFQMIAIGAAILAPVFPPAWQMMVLASWVFALAAVFTLITGWQYVRQTHALLSKEQS